MIFTSTTDYRIAAKAKLPRLLFDYIDVEQLAIDTLVELKMDPMVQNNIQNFVATGRFPWEKKS